MNLLDLTKATLVCGLFAFAVYSFPVLGQVAMIGMVSIIWLSYAVKTIQTLRHR